MNLNRGFRGLQRRFGRYFPEWIRRREAKEWEHRWSKKEYNPPWLERSVSPEIVEAARDGWFPAGATVLDIGCGQGDVVAWLVGEGFTAIGVDVAAAAVTRAQQHHPDLPPETFQVLDITSSHVEGTLFDSFVDRGCFHAIPDRLKPAYVRHVQAMAKPKARLLLLLRAFRGSGTNREAEKRQKLQHVTSYFDSIFVVERVAETNLAFSEDEGPEKDLPGLAIWLGRVNH